MNTVKTTTALVRKRKLALPVLFLFLILFGYNIPGAYAQCHAKFGYKVKGDTVTFYDSSTASGGYGMYWSFGDTASTYTSSSTISHVYVGHDSIYKVCEHIRDSIHHCSDDTCITIKVKPQGCYAYFGHSGTSRKFSFYYNGRTKSGHPTFAWDFGDGGTSKDYSPSHLFSADGSYKVCCTVTDSAGHCSSQYCETIVVSGPDCKAAFLIGSHTYREYNFNNESSSPYSYTSSWDFGDSTTSTDISPKHTFKKIDSSYNVCLTITDTMEKCSIKICKTLRVAPYFCDANFDYTIDGKKVTFNNTSASTFSRTSSWDFGDGSTKSTDQSPSHTYSKDSAYTVCLTIEDKDANCTHKICKKIDFGATYNVTGAIYPDSTRGRKAKVWLIVYNPNDSTLSAVKDTTTDSVTNKYSLIYTFKHVKPGRYYVKAAFDSTNPLYPYYLPTYGNSATQWAKATKIEINHSDASANIEMKKGTNPGGKGFISGKISAGANKVGDPVPHEEVILYDLYYNPVAYTYTDNNGTYQFKNIAMGSYVVYVEVLGVVSQPCNITLSDQKQSVSNIDFTVSPTKVRSLAGISNVQTAQENVSIYPNPVRNDLMISINSICAQDASVLVYDINGRLVSQNNMQVVPGDQVLHLNTAAFKNGMYFVKVQLSHDNYFIQRPIVKAE